MGKAATQVEDKGSICNAYREYSNQGERKMDWLEKSTWKYEIPMVNDYLLLNRLTLPVSKENKWDII